MTKIPKHRQIPTNTTNTEATASNENLPTFFIWLVLVPLVRGGTPNSHHQCNGKGQEEPKNLRRTRTTGYEYDSPGARVEPTNHEPRKQGRPTEGDKYLMGVVAQEAMKTRRKPEPFAPLP